MTGTEEQVPVLIVGGSLVGLSTSVLLAAQGVRHILIERHRGTAIHPRAASFHQRTMEIFRSAGLQEAVEEAAGREFVQNGAIIAVDTLGGKELACFYRTFNEGVEGLSPTRRLFITQIGLEPVLRQRAQALGAQHLYGTELTAFSQDESGVVVELRARDGGEQRTVRAQYLVAADGTHSFMRGALGIDLEGRGSFADCITIYFKADMRALIGDRNLSVVYVNQPGLLAFFRFAITGDAGFLAVFATFDQNGARDSHVGQDFSPERCAQLVRTALGVGAEFPLEIENVQPWSATAATAVVFRKDNVFLAGDAAHIMPPTGGFGGNTGVADAHNLAWKLGMVLRGEAGAGLLDTYEAERKPLCELIVEQAYTRYIERVDASLPATNLAPPLKDAAIELGSIYHSGAVLIEPGADQALVEDPHHASGRPGTRIAHLWLKQDGKPLSTLDLQATGFTLIAGRSGQEWHTIAVQLAAAGAPLSVYLIGSNGLSDPTGKFEAAMGIGAGGALLLRPDGVIAWRSGAAKDAVGQLDSALRRLTFRT